MYACYTRLLQANEIKEVPATTEWIANLRQSYGLVSISISDSWKGPRELQIAEAPFFPEQRDAYNKANEQLAEEGKFREPCLWGITALVRKALEVCISPRR